MIVKRQQEFPEWEAKRLQLLFPSPVLPGSGSKGIISVPYGTPLKPKQIYKLFEGLAWLDAGKFF
jgi:hypothetical protein